LERTYDAWDFENWLRFTLPWQLNLSPSKQVAMKSVFQGFTNYVVGLEGEAPEEFKEFFKTLSAKFDRVSKWRAPKGGKVVPSSYKGKPQTWPNGKSQYELVEKWQIDKIRAELKAFRDQGN